jgi:hypothetical protein
MPTEPVFEHVVLQVVGGIPLFAGSGEQGPAGQFGEQVTRVGLR